MALVVVLTSISLLALLEIGRGRLVIRGLRRDIVEARQARTLARLACGDLRGLALALTGQADRLGDVARRPFALFARRLGNLADDLLDATSERGVPRRLDAEMLRLGPLIDATVAGLDAELGPGLRNWRVSSALGPVRLSADRRALHQALLRLMSGAVGATRAGDWIEIGWCADAAGGTLTITDEGAGSPLATGEIGLAINRGSGAGVALARSLVEAHGGRLTINTAACVGTRVSLWLPASRFCAEIGRSAGGAIVARATTAPRQRRPQNVNA